MTMAVSVCLKNRERSAAVVQARQQAQQLEKKLLLSPQNRTAVAAMRTVCYLLIQLVQKYVTRSPKAYQDYEQLMHCTRILRELGFKPPSSTETAADETTYNADAVINSQDYRYLRNRAIACLATIADLTEKPTAVGTPEFQSGMREGYRRASDIAAAFLTDFGAGVSADE